MNAKERSDPKGSIITGVWNASILSDGHLEADARAPTMSEERRHPPFYVWLSPSERFVRVLFVAMVLGFAGTVALIPGAIVTYWSNSPVLGILAGIAVAGATWLGLFIHFPGGATGRAGLSRLYVPKGNVEIQEIIVIGREAAASLSLAVTRERTIKARSYEAWSCRMGRSIYFRVTSMSRRPELVIHMQTEGRDLASTHMKLKGAIIERLRSRRAA